VLVKSTPGSVDEEEVEVEDEDEELEAAADDDAAEYLAVGAAACNICISDMDMVLPS
jgi:hypothetical protein